MEDSKSSKRPATKWRKSLVRDKDLPDWYLNMPYVVSGYRLHYEPWDCVKSLFEIHTETMNVWLHLGGFLFWLWLVPAIPAMDHWENASAGTIRVYYIVCTIAGIMLAVSAVAHLFACVSRTFWQTFWALDLATLVAGILARSMIETWFLLWHSDLFLWWAGFTGVAYLYTLYHILHDINRLPAVEIGLLFVFSLIPGVILTWLSYDPSAEVLWGEWMASLGVSVPEATLIPLGAATHSGLRAAVHGGMICSGLVAAGFILYGARLPERLSPGFFDIVGASHQWWHLFGVVGLYYFLHGIGGLVEWRHAYTDALLQEAAA